MPLLHAPADAYSSLYTMFRRAIYIADALAAVVNLLSTRAQGQLFLCLGLRLHADCNLSR